jgi:hypothetical protein
MTLSSSEFHDISNKIKNFEFDDLAVAILSDKIKELLAKD